MTFEEMLDQALAMLQRRGRVTYRTLKRQFHLDDDAIEDLKDELLYAHPHVVDDDGRGLVWTGEARPTPTPGSPPAGDQARAPLSYTPPYLAEKILTSKSVLEGERKQVTVLFADLKGSMELLADRDPEEARQLLDPVLERMMAAVHRYEGTVNQVMGDGIMALFGAPIAHEDHAVRACYAALAMQEAIRRYSDEVRREHGVEVQIRVGLNSGEVVVRAIGSDLHMDYSAIGQTTHLAARMEQLAPPGSVRLTADTLRLAEGLVQVTPLGPVPVKGLPAPVEVCELVGAGPARTRLQAFAARGLTPFVGRQAELASLHQSLEQAVAGHGQVVAVIGEPGVGKTRLFHEFTHSSRTQGWLLLESRSTSYGKATPYLPVVDLLKAYFGIEDRNEGRRVLEKLTGRLLTLDPALGPTLPAFLALLEVPVEDPHWQTLEPAQRRQRTLDALKHLLLRESQVQPLLLVFENLHWIDSETQAFLDGLVESLPAARVLLLANYRPEYQHDWGTKTYYTQLRLDPLPPASAEALLQSLLGDHAGLEPLKQRLIERTQGNPFFLEESVRTMVETQVLVGTPGAYRLAQALPSIQVPATVQAVLAARIDRLPSEEKQLLQTAAVIGTEVPLALLQVVAAAPEEALHLGLTHLQAAEFLYETRLFPDIEYTFKHALTQQVAYETLLQERRRALHARIVETLEALAGERVAEQVERMAHHALRGEVWDKALAYFGQAGEKALAQSAYREAVGYFEQALSALPHLPAQRDTREQAIDLRFDLRNALMALGELGRILEHLREAETLAQALGDQRRLGWLSAYMTHYFWLTGDQECALQSGQSALAIASDLGDFGLKVVANTYLGVVYIAQGDYRRAIEFLSWNVASLEGDLIRERFGLTGFPSVLSRSYLGWSHAERGEFAEGTARGEEGIWIAEAADHPFSLIIAHWGVGLLYLRKGDLHKAISVLEGSLRLCQIGNVPRWFAEIASPLGYAYALSGRLAEAIPLLEQGVEQAASMSVMHFHSLRVAWQSEASLLAGRMGDAMTLAVRAHQLACAQKERGHLAWVIRLLGEIAAQHEPPEVQQAEDYYHQALILAEELGMRPLLAHCHLGLGALYGKVGRQDQARAELSTAIELYRSMEMTFWLPQAEAALAEVEGR
jgi:class 3 adenylate cyclase/tetratricopeptide (TPR) repeat protein